MYDLFFFFFSSRRRHTRLVSDWSSDVCSSDLVIRGGGMQPGQVGADQPDLEGSMALDAGEDQVAAGRDVPWHVDQAAEVAEERAWLRLGAALQVAAQAERLEGGHAHALAVDRVEAGDRVAHHQQAVREAVQSFVAVPDAGW